MRRQQNDLELRNRAANQAEQSGGRGRQRALIGEIALGAVIALLFVLFGPALALVALVALAALALCVLSLAGELLQRRGARRRSR